jgi:hypothetical protein
MEEIGNRVADMENKVEKLDHSVKDHEKRERYLGQHQKTKSMNHGYRG